MRYSSRITPEIEIRTVNQCRDLGHESNSDTNLFSTLTIRKSVSFSICSLTNSTLHHFLIDEQARRVDPSLRFHSRVPIQYLGPVVFAGFAFRAALARPRTRSTAKPKTRIFGTPLLSASLFFLAIIVCAKSNLCNCRQPQCRRRRRRGEAFRR
jgi:hypothetical protein